MKSNIEKLNKQIASFMLLSLALNASVAAGGADIANNVGGISNSINHKEVMLKYGAPIFPGERITPDDSARAISMYAVPAFPIREITPVEPTPVDPPIVPMYGVPNIPVIKDKPIKSPVRTEDINSTLMNIEKNLKRTNDPKNVDMSNFIKSEDVISQSKNLDNITADIGSNSPKAAAKLQIGDLIYTNYGSYKTIEPASYSFYGKDK